MVQEIQVGVVFVVLLLVNYYNANSLKTNSPVRSGCKLCTYRVFVQNTFYAYFTYQNMAASIFILQSLIDFLEKNLLHHGNIYFPESQNF